MTDLDTSRRPSPVQTALLVIIALILIGWALRATYAVSMPIVLAFFLAILVHPCQAWIVRHVPHWLRWLGPMACLLLVLGTILGGLAVVGWSLSKATDRIPQYQERFQNAWQSVVDYASQHGITLAENVMGVETIRQRLLDFLTAGFTSIWWWLALVLVVLFLMLLMLLEVRDWRDKTEAAFCCGGGEAAEHTVDMIARKLRTFLWVRTAMSVLNGGVVALWLWLIGVEFWYIWGITTFVLNYIPNLGSVIAVIPPAIIAFLQFGPAWALLAVGGMALLDQFLGNYLDPRLQGKALDISAAVVLATILLWAWIWGVIGMLLATPITVCIILICEQVQALHPIAQLLKRKPDPALDPNNANH